MGGQGGAGPPRPESPALQLERAGRMACPEHPVLVADLRDVTGAALLTERNLLWPSQSNRNVPSRWVLIS